MFYQNISILLALSLNIHKLMGMTHSSHRSSAHCFVVYQKHYKVEQTYVVPMGIEPERHKSLVYHCPFNYHRAQLSYNCWPYVVLVINLRQH